MVTVEQLEALDLLQWFRSGTMAASHALCDESSVTRRVRAALKALGIRLNRGQEFLIQGNKQLLRLERIVHQHARFLGVNKRPLRLEATHYVRRQLEQPAVQGWVLGPCHHRGYGTLLSMLQERIIDAWITSDLFDLPDDSAFRTFRLWDWPGELVVDACHPLAHERGLKKSDIDRFPSLILPDALYPGLARVVHAKGLGQQKQLNRYDVGCWLGLTEDAATISYGSCLSLAVDAGLRRLDWDLELTGGEALIVLREWADEPAIALLLDDLRSRQLQLQPRFPQLVGHL